MKRLIVETILPVGSVFDAPAEEQRHLVSVRRIKADEMLEALDGKGGLATCSIVGLEKRRLTLKVESVHQEDRESQLKLGIGLAIPTHLSTIDDMLPGLVPLGVQTIALAPTVFGGRLKKDPQRYQERLQHIMLAALKQSGRLVLPELRFFQTWADLCHYFADSYAHNRILHPKQNQQMHTIPSSLGLLVGPEAGFSDDELEQAFQADARPLDLGPRILRMETAAIGACFWAQQQFLSQ